MPSKKPRAAPAVMEPEVILGVRSDDKGTKRQYAMRWSGWSGQRRLTRDRWMLDTDIDPLDQRLVEDFESTPLKARWTSKAAEVFVAEAVLASRVEDGRPQSLVRWLGFKPKWDMWIDDADFAAAPPKPATFESNEPTITDTDSKPWGLHLLAMVSLSNALTTCGSNSEQRGYTSDTAIPIPNATAIALPTSTVANTNKQSGMAAVRQKLSNCRLEQYADKFDALGYDDLDYLLELKANQPAELSRLAEEEIGMKVGHVDKLIKWL